ncbi:helix-hairpin-helix domain-containing protein [Halorubrum tebenquichense]|uniref:Uncharacterized protein n=1 Tax=Halorubrum tebenquichense DSM 14210 TaxID=1227485 RepID=M0DKQ8_9EURY|nr:helix-hairpin-helix domain-containing protein [Halorubrum tebenquichense]ELZ35403.1 hypothetical protein C472_12735 [Halorubrum tebenquichense DSM 14210]
MSKVTATDDVHALVDEDEVSEAIADRLADNGFETIADLLIADQADLEDVPYVGEQRAADILDVVDGLMGAPEPRDVDVEATESVVSEAAIPLSVRRGDAVLTKSSAYGSTDVFHTQACQHVETNDLVERDRSWAEKRDLKECQYCADPDARARNASAEDETDPLVDPCEVVLEATLGEKLQITLADRDAWARPWNVIETAEPTEWESATGETWQTRRLRLSESPSGKEAAREFDLVLIDDEIRIEDPPVNRPSHQPDARSWRVESVGAVGRVSTTSLVQLQTDDEQGDAKPEGDDTWRQYQKRGETA